MHMWTGMCVDISPRVETCAKQMIGTESGIATVY